MTSVSPGPSAPRSIIRRQLGDIVARGRTLLARSFVRDLRWNLSAYAMARLTTLIVGMIVAGGLGATQFARLTYFILSVNMLGAFSDLGVSMATTKATVESRSNAAALPKLIGGVHLTIPVWLIALAVITQVSDVRSWSATMLVVLSVSGLACAWQSISAAMLTGLGKQRALFAGNCVFSVIQIASSVLAVESGDVRFVIAGLGLAYVAQTSLQFYLAAKTLAAPARQWFSPSPSSVRQAIGMVGIMALTSMIASVIPFAIGDHLAGIDKIGVGLAVFGVGSTFFGLVMAVPARVGMLFFVRQVGHHLSADRSRTLIRADLRAITVTVGSAIAGIIGVAILSPLLLPRYGQEISANAWPILGYTLTATLVSASLVLGSRVIAASRPALWCGVTLIQAATTFCALKALSMDPIWLPIAATALGYGAALLAGAIVYWIAIAGQAK